MIEQYKAIAWFKCIRANIKGVGVAVLPAS